MGNLSAMLNIVRRVGVSHYRPSLPNRQAGLTGLGFKQDFHRSRRLSVNDIQVEQAGPSSQEQLNGKQETEESNNSSMEAKVTVVETKHDSLQTEVNRLRNSGERALYFVIGTVCLGLVLKEHIIDNNLGEKLKAEVKCDLEAVEGRVMNEVKATEGRLKNEVKATEGRLMNEVKGTEGRLMNEVKATEGRLMNEVKVAEERVTIEVKSVKEDVKTVKGSVDQMKGSLDTLIKLMEDRKD